MRRSIRLTYSIAAITLRLTLPTVMAIVALQSDAGGGASISDQLAVRFAGPDTKPLGGVRIGTTVDCLPERALSLATRQHPKIRFRDADHRSAQVSGLDGVVRPSSDLVLHFVCNVFRLMRSGTGGMTVLDAKEARCRWEDRRCQTVFHST